MRRTQSIYNFYAARNVHRLGGLCDAVFAVAMTLLILNIHAPDPTGIHNERELLSALSKLLPQLMVYLMSFLTLGIFWVGQQTQINHLERIDRHYTWISLAVLSLVTLIPLSTLILATFITFRTALLVYWANLFLLGIAIISAWHYARAAHLEKRGTANTVHRAFLIRICTAQALYTFATLLGFVFNTYVSIGLIVILQLNYAIAPRSFPWREPGAPKELGGPTTP